MTIRTLKIFIAVAEEKTMHAAARRLYISQPSVSQAIAELEKEYHVKLFERLSQRLYLTETGRKLLSYAYHLTDAYDEVHRLLSSEKSFGRLRIGASVSAGTCMINDIIENLRRENPKTELFITIDNTSKIEKLLLESQLDAAVVEGVIVENDLICQKICEDELIVISSPGHPLASRRNLGIEVLAGQSFISREPGSNDRNQFEQFLSEHQIAVQKSWTCSNTEAIKNAVLRGHGLAILSRMLVEKELRSGELKKISLQNVCIKRDIKLVYHKDKYLSEELVQFAAACGLTL